MQYAVASGVVGLISVLAYVTTLLCPVILDHQIPLIASLVLSACGFFAVHSVSLGFRETFIKARLFGIDLNKMTTKRNKDGSLCRPVDGIPIPEAMGVICAAGYITFMSFFLPFPFLYTSASCTGSTRGHLSAFVAALLSISLMAFLGFVDNVLELKWRHKIILPSVATLPLILVYLAEIGETGIFLPRWLHSVVGYTYVDLGVLFVFFLWALIVFATNSINILAGVNGLEVGQSVVVSGSMIAYNLIQMSRGRIEVEHQLVSIYILLPFFMTSCALLHLNWFPAKVFVGDTYCYFAGMTLASAGILGHYSKTLCLFFIPQALNFAYSIPQIIRAIPCPRHRMPTVDISQCKWEGDNMIPIPMEETKVDNSYTEFEPAKLNKLGKLCFWILRTFRLAKIVEGEGDTVRMSNLTLINFFLYIFGPMREDRLTMALLAFQVACSLLAFWVRFSLSMWFYDVIE